MKHMQFVEFMCLSHFSGHSNLHVRCPMIHLTGSVCNVCSFVGGPSNRLQSEFWTVWSKHRKGWGQHSWINTLAHRRLIYLDFVIFLCCKGCPIEVLCGVSNDDLRSCVFLSKRAARGLPLRNPGHESWLLGLPDHIALSENSASINLKAFD